MPSIWIGYWACPDLYLAWQSVRTRPHRLFDMLLSDCVTVQFRVDPLHPECDGW